jgi:hypothetical protein
MVDLAIHVRIDLANNLVYLQVVEVGERRRRGGAGERQM